MLIELEDLKNNDLNPAEHIKRYAYRYRTKSENFYYILIILRITIRILITGTIW